MRLEIGKSYKTKKGTKVVVTDISVPGTDLNKYRAMYPVGGKEYAGQHEIPRRWTLNGVHDLNDLTNGLSIVGIWEEPQQIDERMDAELNRFFVKCGTNYTPYFVLGRKEIDELTAIAFNSRRLGIFDNLYKTPNCFVSSNGEHRIIAIPVDSHFSLGFDADLSPHLWGTKK